MSYNRSLDRINGFLSRDENVAQVRIQSLQYSTQPITNPVGYKIDLVSESYVTQDQYSIMSFNQSQHMVCKHKIFYVSLLYR